MAAVERNPVFHTNLYHGPSGDYVTRRNISDINKNTLSLITERDKPFLTFDSILKSHLERIKKSGEKELFFLDIGTGEGYLLEDLSKEKDVSQSLQFLSNNPDFKIIAIGLTDATDSLHQGQVVRNYESKNKQITAINYFYSLHRSQPLASFLNEVIKEEKLDLVFATECFQYLNTSVFLEVINTISNRLSIEGQLIASGYLDVPSGFMPHGGKFYFPNKNKLHPWQELMRQLDTIHLPYVIEKSFFDNLTSEELKIASKRAIKMFAHLKVINNSRKDKIISDIDNDLIKWKVWSDVYNRPIFMTSPVVDILCESFNRLLCRRSKRETIKRNQILKQVKEVELSYFSRSDRGFILTKNKQ